MTLGSPAQLTGGYLYHRRMAAAAPDHDVDLGFVSVPNLPFPLPAAWGRGVLRQAAGADVALLDSIATAYLAPALALGRPLVPMITVAHQTFGGIDHGAVRGAVQAPLDRFVFLRTDAVIAASEALAADLQAGGRLGTVPVEVVPPGCDVGVPEEPLPDLRLGRRAAFLTVGNWVARKGILDVVEAFARLPPDSATLHLVGRADVDARYAALVERRLSSPHLAGRVVVHGPVPTDRVATLMAAADAFVLPSLREPYGTVYGEALALGCPVVGWRAGNLPHLARDGEEGIVLPAGDMAALTAGLERVAADDGFRERLRRGAQARGRTLPTWDDSARRFFEIVRGVVARRVGGAG